MTVGAGVGIVEIETAGVWLVEAVCAVLGMTGVTGVGGVGVASAMFLSLF